MLWPWKAKQPHNRAIFIQWSYHQMYYSPFNNNRKTALQKRKCPEISSSALIYNIYISICIYIHPVHTSLLKKHHVFPQSNTNIRTTSPGAYIHTIVSCCVCFFYSEKIKMLTHKGQLFNNSHQCNIQTKRKNIKFKTSDAYFMFVAWYQSRPCCGSHFTCSSPGF